MKTKLSLVDRFLADTPDFFKIVQFLGLLILFAHSVLVHYGYSGRLLDDMETLGFALPFLSQFVVKDVAQVAAAANPLDAFMQIVSALPDQFGQLKDSLLAQAANHSDAMQNIMTAVTGMGAPVGKLVAMPGVDEQVIDTSKAAGTDADTTKKTPAIKI